MGWDDKRRRIRELLTWLVVYCIEWVVFKDIAKGETMSEEAKDRKKLAKKSIVISITFLVITIFALISINNINWLGDVKTEIIAHRGASYIAPENTVASTILAWQKGADAVEIDVYLSSDDQVVVIHDSTTNRTTGGTNDLVVSNTTSTVLRSLDVGSWRGSKYAGAKIPFLHEIIDAVDYIVEWKQGGHAGGFP